ncbi:ligase [Bifidobacterium sp. DSM 109960]|uniref:Ligase n=1 Tax=Bifidobacterium erythrocebi TaxID=2675325 RepID=A0A7Y0EUG5_9BIFI|nr:lipoate--protein ligase family protein [Bifidobacterium sp. DSM 109960]NMM96655.1 ligase [Bifidobacterium sp. DSM 109960]
MRGEYKTPGGKLAGVCVEYGADGRPHCRIDGDFFIDGDDAEAQAVIRGMERRLDAQLDQAAVPAAMSAAHREAVKHTVEQSLAEVLGMRPGIRILGAGSDAIATAFVRAIAPECSERGENDESNEPDRNEGKGRAAKIQTQSRHAGGESQGLNRDETGEWLRRWHDLSPNIVLDIPRDPEAQMDTDVQWAREVAAGERKPTVRFWQWASPCVVVGRFQSIRDEVHEDVARARGMQVVRRCTGGGAMFIEPGNTITYSLYAPLEFVGGIDIARSYQLCDYWLVHALRGLGLDARFSGLNDIASQYGKIGGAAQRRFPTPRGVETAHGAVLHHVTLAYDIDAEAMESVLNTSREKMRDKAVRSAVKRVDPLKRQTGMSRDALVEYLMESLRSFAR